MRKIFTLTALLVVLGIASAASADNWRRGRPWQQRREVVTRDHRNWQQPARFVRRDVVYRPRAVYNRPRVVYANNGWFTFNGGIRYRWTRPVMRRYFDIRVRPLPIVERYASVQGYIWIRGHWQWNGYEWMWMPGHYEIDASYYGYDDYPGYTY